MNIDLCILTDLDLSTAASIITSLLANCGRFAVSKAFARKNNASATFFRSFLVASVDDFGVFFNRNLVSARAILLYRIALDGWALQPIM
jgi:hypothetical protein